MFRSPRVIATNESLRLLNGRKDEGVVSAEDVQEELMGKFLRKLLQIQHRSDTRQPIHLNLHNFLP